MIEIRYYQDKNEVAIKGHAYSGEAGHDLVCASVSALFWTLLANATAYEHMKYGKVGKLKAEKGNARIKFNALKTHKDTVIFGFNSVCVGFEVLAENYPKNIFYKIL